MPTIFLTRPLFVVEVGPLAGCYFSQEDYEQVAFGTSKPLLDLKFLMSLNLDENDEDPRSSVDRASAS